MMDTLDCGHPSTETDGCGTGYGITKGGAKHCYACCAEQDREQMRRTDRILLYLSMTGSSLSASGLGLARPIPGHTYYGDNKATNWPGSLSIPVGSIKVGNHNIAGRRYDCWFTFEGREWHGVQYGDYTQLLHCNKLRA